MNTRTKAINTTLTMVGALILLSVLTWVVFTISQPLIPNTGGATSTPETSAQDDSAIATTTDRMLESVDDHGSGAGGADDPTGNSHSE